MKTLKEHIKESKPTLVVFEHVEDQSVSEMKTLVEELRKEFGDALKVVHVDTTHEGGYKMEYKLHEYPTWILFKEGQELMRVGGKKTLGQLSDMVKTAM